MARRLGIRWPAAEEVPRNLAAVSYLQLLNGRVHTLEAVLDAYGQPRYAQKTNEKIHLAMATLSLPESTRTLVGRASTVPLLIAAAPSFYS